MKRTCMQHTKLLKLTKMLGNRCLAVGLLESVWHLCARETPHGDIGRLDNDTIAIAIQWDGNADEMMACLIKAGFVDEHPEHRLVVHDWHEHADDATKKLVLRSGRPFVTVGEEDCGPCEPSVYFIQQTDTGHIKIGHTEGSPDQRLKQLQTGHSTTLKLIGTVTGSRTDEAAWHRRFKDLRMEGEWFKAEPMLLAAIQEATRGAAASNGESRRIAADSGGVRQPASALAIASAIANPPLPPLPGDVPEGSTLGGREVDPRVTVLTDILMPSIGSTASALARLYPGTDPAYAQWLAAEAKKQGINSPYHYVKKGLEEPYKHYKPPARERRKPVAGRWE